MLTRAFLLFLAMLTGLSAAQAADGTRVCQGAEVAATLAAFDSAVHAEAAIAGVPSYLQLAAVGPIPAPHPTWTPIADRAPAPATRFSDRSRT
jgi:hypothetical protein